MLTEMRKWGGLSKIPSCTDTLESRQRGTGNKMIKTQMIDLLRISISADGEVKIGGCSSSLSNDD